MTSIESKKKAKPKMKMKNNNAADELVAKQLIEGIEGELQMTEPSEDLEGVWLPDAAWAEIIRLLKKAGGIVD